MDAAAVSSKSVPSLAAPGAPSGSPAPRRVSRLFVRLENIVIVLFFFLMAAIPILEVLFRRFQLSIAGGSSLVQHCCLIVGMLGGAVAARENKLLNLSAAPMYLKGRAKTICGVLANSVASFVSILLTVETLRFVLVERTAGNTISYGVPVWTLELFLPAGFGVIAARLLTSAGRRKWTSVLAGCVAVLLLFLGFAVGGAAKSHLLVPASVLLAIATLLGTPIFAAIAGVAMLIYWGQGQPLGSIPVDHYRLVVNPTIPAIPLFTLAGYFLAESGASRRLLRVCQGAVGHFRGGPAMVTAAVCALFTAFTGASGVTILALGGLLMPMLSQARFPERAALGLITSAGSLGLLFPPCLPLLLYAIVASNSGSLIEVREMFLAGIGPGIVLMILTTLWGMTQGSREARQPFSPADLKTAAWDAKWELLIPVVAIGSLFLGFATPVEAAAITLLYILFIETAVYRDLKFSSLPRVTGECAMLVGGVLLILGLALALTNAFMDARVPDRLLAWAQNWITGRWMFLLALNVLLLVVGCLMDVFSAIVVVVPLVVPIANAYGIDPLHLGIIFLANLELGFLTPPVGMNLFLASYRFNKPMFEVIRSVLPILLIYLGGLLVITYMPALTLFLPDLLRRP